MAGAGSGSRKSLGKRADPEPNAGFGSSLVAAIRSILDDARAALRDSALSDAEAVHRLRRAFKRLRALMRVLSAPIGEPADRMRTEARDLMRALSGSRDGQAAIDALRDLGSSDLPLSPTSRKSMETRLIGLRSQAEAASFTAELRLSIAEYLDAAEQSIARLPFDSLEFGAIADGFTATYRRARRLVPDSWPDAGADDLHELRKRVVEHRHQMDLLEPLWPKLTKTWTQEAQKLRERLGACQDLSVLESLTAPNGPLAPWRAKLTPLIKSRREKHLTAAAKIAGRLFAEKPNAFRRRIEALWLAQPR